MTRDGLLPSSVDIKAHLRDLLARDPGVFLERHGASLSDADLAAFQALRASSYEVNHHLARLERARSGAAASAAGAAASGGGARLSAAAKNRRLAQMRRLEGEGDFFSLESMRQRAPLLYHEHIGRHEPDAEAGGPPLPPLRAGDSLAGGILRAHDEAQRRAQLQQELTVEAAQTSQQEEEEDEAEPAEPAGAGAQEGADGGGPSGGSGEEAGGVGGGVEGQRQREFLTDMQQRYLLGAEEGVDYAGIDADEGLDEDWAAEAARDLEDAYFADD